MIHVLRHLSVAMIAIGTITTTHAQVINEFVANHTGNPDDFEFVEVFGDPDTDYSNLTILQLEGDITSGSGSPGVIDSVFPVGTTDSEGYWRTEFLSNVIENGSQSLLLVSDFSGMAGDDLDPGDDGTLDTTPWTALLDSVAVDDLSDAGDQTYAQTTLEPNFDSSFFTPGGASRLPNGIDTDSIADWKRNDFDGEGLPGLSGSVGFDEAFNTPGTENQGTLLESNDPIISEFVADHAGTDTLEFLEVFATPKLDYSAWTLLVLEGDQAENPGQIDSAHTVGSTDVAGFWYTGSLPQDTLENGSLTILLVRDFSGSVGDDLDTNDDGGLDSTPWSDLNDSVSLDDGDASDIAYGSPVLGMGLRVVGSMPGGASRHPYFQDSDSVDDWFRNDFEGEGLGLATGTTSAGEAFNTPGTVTNITNVDYYAPVNSSNATLLRMTLHPVIDDHIRYPYSSDDLDTWDILEAAQQDPTDPTRIIDIYKNQSFTVGSGYNREHSWARTYGIGDLTDENVAFTDTHHLFLSDITYNSNRGSKFFDYCPSGCSEDVTLFNPANGMGGGAGTYPGNSNWTNGSAYEVWHFRRGDIARAQFYMALRYEGGTHSVTGYSEPDLQLIDGQNQFGQPFMGQLSTLVQWHLEDPVDDEERARNDHIYSVQGNRNPFVDHPEWVELLFTEGSHFFLDGFE